MNLTLLHSFFNLFVYFQFVYLPFQIFNAISLVFTQTLEVAAISTCVLTPYLTAWSVQLIVFSILTLYSVN